MLNRYYEQELANLRTLAAEFGRRNPALAPLLGSSAAVDSDVERVLEGVAFMTGLVRQRLDDDFPEFIQGLAQLLFPHFLRPLPCMTILQFTGHSAAGESVDVPAGTTFASVPIDGERAVFRSVFPVPVNAVNLSAVRWEGGDTVTRSLVVDFAFQGQSAADWRGDSLRLWLGGNFGEASRIYRLLMRHVREIRIGAPGEALTVLPASALRPVGFDAALPLLPWPAGAHPAWRVLHEYFALPEKLLFLELAGLRRWQARGTGNVMRVRFVFNDVPDWAPEVNSDTFVLNATPAVNLYEQDAHPIRIDNRQPEYRIQPGDRGSRKAQVFSVNKVHARLPDGSETEYRPFSAFDREGGIYHVRLKPSAVSTGYDHHLSIPYPAGTQPVEQTLSIRLTCTDGARPDGLRLGDVREPTDSTPSRISFANILGVTPHRPPGIDGDLLWRVLSHINANHLTLASRDHLRELLSLYLPPRRSDSHQDAARHRLIESIEHVEAVTEQRIVRGTPVQGSTIRIDCRGDYFASPGSFYVFGCVLDEFFAGCAAINTFTALTLRDIVNGDTLAWPARTGRHRLI